MDTQQGSLLDSAEQLKNFKGAFISALTRNNRKIRDDRALAIMRSAQLHYKRKVEDMQVELEQLRADRTAMLDLSPTDANSLTLSSDFDAPVFCSKDIAIGVKIYNLSITLGIAKTQYEELFGEKL